MTKWRTAILLATLATIMGWGNGGALAYSKADYATYRNEYMQLTSAYGAMQREFDKVQKRYIASTEGLAACRTSVWASIFEKPLTEVDTHRRTLEAGRTALFKRRGELEGVRIAIEKENRELSARAGQIGDRYWDDLEDLTERMRASYILPFKDEIILGYESYLSGIRSTMTMVEYYKLECEKPLPSKDLARVFLENAGAIIKGIADAIVSLKKIVG